MKIYDSEPVCDILLRGYSVYWQCQGWFDITLLLDSGNIFSITTAAWDKKKKHAVRTIERWSSCQKISISSMYNFLSKKESNWHSYIV